MAFYLANNGILRKKDGSIIINTSDCIKITTIDVGYGDAILCQTKNKNILFDVGASTQREKFFTALQQYGVSTIDHLFITHPHSDHFGNFPYMLGRATTSGAFPVNIKNVYTSGLNITYYLNTASLQTASIGTWSLATEEQKTNASIVAKAFKNVPYTYTVQSNGLKKVTGQKAADYFSAQGLNISDWTSLEGACQLNSEYMLSNNIPHYIVNPTISGGRIQPITINLGDSVSFHAYWPTEDYVTESRQVIIGSYALNEIGYRNTAGDEYGHGTDVNNTSILGKLIYKNFSMLITGDCSATINGRVSKRINAQDNLLQNTNSSELHCTIYKSCHHGHTTENPQNWIQAIHPQTEIISTGKSTTKADPNGIKGNPDRPGLTAATLAGVNKTAIFSTRHHGDITVFTDGNGYVVKPQRENSEWFDEWVNESILPEST